MTPASRGGHANPTHWMLEKDGYRSRCSLCVYNLATAIEGFKTLKLGPVDRIPSFPGKKHYGHVFMGEHHWATA